MAYRVQAEGERGRRYYQQRCATEEDNDLDHAEVTQELEMDGIGEVVEDEDTLGIAPAS